MREWDPIGVAGIEDAVDEYDTYVSRVYVMLMDERANAEAIAAYLFEIATGHMGLSTDSATLSERGANAAAALIALRAEFETH